MGLVSWNFFRGRLGLDVQKFVTDNKCSSYDELVRVLLNRGVAPPPMAEVGSCFRPVPAPKAEKVAPKAEKVAPPQVSEAPKRRRPRTTQQRLGAGKKTKGSNGGAKSTKTN